MNGSTCVGAAYRCAREIEYAYRFTEPSMSDEMTYQGEPLQIQTLTGSAIRPWLDALAELRLGVFSTFPYLYHAPKAEEFEYLTHYVESPSAAIFLVREGDRAVGMSTVMPMTEAEAEFQVPFREAGWTLSSLAYFGESILLPEYRGRGLGHAFFERREAYARGLPGVTHTTFCAVERPADHPERPEAYQPLDGFWRRRGYEHHPELAAHFRWRDIGDEALSTKRLSFWIKPLEPA
ncbi:GNAT family N-acetyltransferase [Larsenimonas salina]|uniref:GNAT family N-acetyltransferase n=1 Tax=Larsenimonas salina TaxID=1295565 RepID=UPI0020743276|nr:GNAT family N-acetyltransferase [Larsenimonas salina]